MDINGYFRRIHYDSGYDNGVLYKNLATLRGLQLHHVFAIPFETLDICNQIPILLQTDILFQKVILDNRGGYCYELNYLFYRLLSHCGFKVSMVSGRLLHGYGYGRENEHMALIVEMQDRKWLVDVGYGDFSLAPLSISSGEIQSDARNCYQIVDPVVVDGRSYLGVAKWNASQQDFKIVYVFTTEPRELSDFEDMNVFHQTSSASHFAQSLICTLPTKEGRITLINNKLFRTENGKRQVRLIRDERHREELLEKYFQMDMVYLP
jgi:N-hydroxyarylamine O-acetyltransferase